MNGARKILRKERRYERARTDRRRAQLHGTLSERLAPLGPSCADRLAAPPRQRLVTIPWAANGKQNPRTFASYHHNVTLFPSAR